MDEGFSVKDYKQAPRSYYIYRPTQRVEEVNRLDVKQSQPMMESKMVDDEQRNMLGCQMADEKDIVAQQIISNAIIVDNNTLSLASTPNLSPQQQIPPCHKNPTIFLYHNKCYYLTNNLNFQHHQDINSLEQQQQPQQLSAKTPYIQLTYFNIPNYSKLWREKFTITNYQSLQRSYLPYLWTIKGKQSTPAECTRNRLPRLYFPNDLANLSCCQLPQPNNHIVYLFGGVFKQQLQYSNLLWRIDLSTHTIQLVKQQGEQIEHRQDATLLPYTSNWLILYGGYNLSTCSIFADFYCYNITTSVWYIIETQFENLLTPRIHPTFVFNHHLNKFYIFGGLLFDYNGNQRMLNDMFELTLQDMDAVVGKNKKYKGNFTCKTILPKQFDEFPSKRTGHKCVWISDEILLMVGGQRQHENYNTINQSLNQNQIQHMFFQKNYNNDVWIFDTNTERWTQVLSQNTQTFMVANAYFGMQQLQRKQNGILEFIIFGGQNCGLNSAKEQMNVNVSKLEVDVRAYHEWSRQNKNKSKEICKLCEEHNIHQPRFNKPIINSFPSSQVDNWILTGMPFPFTAFSLLAQHSIQRQSTYFVMNYKQYQQKQNQLVFQDDNYLPYTAEQLNKQIHILGNKDMTDLLGVGDKKYKSYHLREYNMIQFCNHLKIAGLRLGEQVFFIAGNANRQAIVYLLRKQQVAQDRRSLRLNRIRKQSFPVESVYKSYFFAINYATSLLLPGYSEYVRDQVMKTYSDTIRYFLKKTHKGVGTMLKIKRLRKILACGSSEQQPVMRYQLTPVAQRNTIILQNPQLSEIKNEQLRRLAERQSIDVNLRAYLSSCFLNRSTSLLLKVSRFAPLKPIAAKKDDNTKFKPIVIDDLEEEEGGKGGKTRQKGQLQSQQKKKSWKGSGFVSNVAKYIESHQKDGTKEKGKQIIIDLDDESNQNQKQKIVEQKKQLQNEKEIKQVQKNQRCLQQLQVGQQKRLQKQVQKDKQERQKGQQEKQKNTQEQVLCQKPEQQSKLLLSKIPPQSKQLINSFTQIHPQLMLPKIDYLKQHKQLTEIDLDAFNQFDCKTIQVYYWRNKQSHIDSYINNQTNKKNKIKQEQSNGNDQENDMRNRTKVTITVGDVVKTYYCKVITNKNKGKRGGDSDDQENVDNSVLFPNGLLIYYKSRLVKRYAPSFGVLAPFMNSPVGNLVGVIQLNEKFPVNVFSTAFINQDIQLQQLYSRIQHVAYLYSKMDPPPITSAKRSRQEKKLQQKKSLQKQEVNDENNRMKAEEVNLSVVDNQQIEGTKRVKLQ